jgi:predicted AAA+ superfamily ATPase
MAKTVYRLLGDALLQAQDAPVLILEGARAVGKTTAVRNQLLPQGFSYATFADRATLQFAAADLTGWVRRLPLPAVIDEAQLLPELPLVIKEYVDTLGLGTHFVLTGSASIGRTGLGGADPLARRVRRFTMYPLTQWELAGLKGSVIDALFDATIVPVELPVQDDAELLETLAYGGFPSYVLQRGKLTRTRLLERIRSDTLAVLSTSVLPELVFNPTIALEALDALLRTPGAIFNATRFAQLLEIDKRTMDRYLGIFGRLFLVHWLPNSATTPANQSHTRAKVHPVDTALAVEALQRAGVQLSADRPALGGLLESHVVNQLNAARGWAKRATTVSYWRESGDRPKEVDLVIDGFGGRRIAIEVKLATRIQPSDLAGLKALQRARGFDRGFVFYTGADVLQLTDTIWALPLATLSTDSWVRLP